MLSLEQNLKVNNWNTRTSCEICSKLTIKTSEWRQWRRSGIFIVNFEHVIAGWVNLSLSAIAVSKKWLSFFLDFTLNWFYLIISI